MRVISQKGIEPMVDMPYEQATLTVKGKFISAIVPNGADMLIANYSTREKAEKVIKKLLEKYEETYCWNSYCYSLPSVFYFPDDSEV